MCDATTALDRPVIIDHFGALAILSKRARLTVRMCPLAALALTRMRSATRGSSSLPCVAESLSLSEVFQRDLKVNHELF